MNIMSLLEDILYKTKSAVGIVGEKAGHFVDISKLTINLAELKSIRRKELESLGEIFYLSQKEDSTKNDSCFSKIFSEIESLDKNIEKLNREIAKIKNKLVCKKCGSNNAQNSKYCCECGASLKYGSCSCQDFDCEGQQSESRNADATSNLNDDNSN
jgi:hypothetical protein